MKLSLSLLMGLVGAAASATAAPITYDITFIATSGIAPTSGTFTYDSALPTFTAFTVVWNGLNLDLTASANAPKIEAFECGGGSGPGTALVTFTEIMQVGSLAGSCFFPQTWSVITDPRPPAGQVPATWLNLGGRYIPRTGNSGVEATISSGFTGDGSFTITQTSAVPEPATIWLIVAGGGILAVRRRRDSAKSCRTFPQ